MDSFEGDRPRWLQVYEDMRRKIVGGVLPPGAPAPTELGLAAEYGVSRSTVRKVRYALCAEGLIEVREPVRKAYVALQMAADEVFLDSGDRATIRTPSRAERRLHGLGEGEALVHIERQDHRMEIHGARRVILVVR
jgi:GntR family transcriptional regulator/MocR family aminotransferase